MSEKELASEELVRKIRDRCMTTGRNPKKPQDYSEVTAEVFRAHPQLAERYRYEPDRIEKHGVEKVRELGL